MKNRFPFAVTFLKWFDHRSTLARSLYKNKTTCATKRKLSVTFNINRTRTRITRLLSANTVARKINLQCNIRSSLHRRCQASIPRRCARRETFLLQNNLIIPPSKRVALTFTLNCIFCTASAGDFSLLADVFNFSVISDTTGGYWSIGRRESWNGTTEVQVFLIYKIGKFTGGWGARATGRRFFKAQSREEESRRDREISLLRGRRPPGIIFMR